MDDQPVQNRRKPTATSIVTMFVLAACVCLILLVAAALGGFGAYACRSFELPLKIGTAICGGLSAMVAAVAGCPIGAIFLSKSRKDSPRLSEAGLGFGALILLPLINSEIFLFSAVTGAVTGLLTSESQTAMSAAIATAVFAPLVGMAVGAICCGEGESPPSE